MAAAGSKRHGDVSERCLTWSDYQQHEMDIQRPGKQSQNPPKGKPEIRQNQKGTPQQVFPVIVNTNSLFQTQERPPNVILFHFIFSVQLP